MTTFNDNLDAQNALRTSARPPDGFTGIGKDVDPQAGRPAGTGALDAPGQVASGLDESRKTRDTASDAARTATRQAAGVAEDAVDTGEKKGQELMTRLVSGAHAAIDRLADAATPAVERLKGAYGNASGKLADVAGQASDMNEKWIADARGVIRDNPLAAVAAALAIGAIFVKLTSTSRRVPPDREDD